jgi:tetratricopeptide (TPR) repeat protein
VRPTGLRRGISPLLLALAACATTSGGNTSSGNTSGAGRPAANAPGGDPAPRTATLSRAPNSAGGSAPAGARRELSPRAQRLFDEAVAAAEEQKRLKVPTDWEILERRWRAVAEAEPIPEAFFNLGVALEHRRRPDDARAAYRRALAIDPGFSPAAVNLALLDEAKDPHQAAQAWTEMMRRFPDDPVPQARLAALYQAAGQHDEAWRLAREVLVRDPRSLGAYKVMMRVALDRGRFDLAQLLAVKARKLDPADPEIVSFVGDVYSRQREEAAAVAQWKKAVAMKDDFLPARYALLASSLGKQHWEGVAEQAQVILRLVPSDARVHLVLGIAYRHLGQPDKALAAFDDAQRAGSDTLPEVHLARAVTFMKAKDRCEPALAELRLYMAAAGPAVAMESAAPRLQRECEQIVAAGRQAEEAAREMKALAEREAAGRAASAGKAAPAPSAPGEVSPPPIAEKGGPRADATRSDNPRGGPTR